MTELQELVKIRKILHKLLKLKLQRLRGAEYDEKEAAIK